MQGLAGKKILVTGASSGIGRSCVLRLAQQQASLILVGRNEQALRSIAVEPQPRICVCDLTDETRIKLLVAELKKELGTIEGCVLAAGAHDVRPRMMESPTSLQKIWAVNVQACLGFLGAALKSRLLARGGAVVLFSSVAVRAGGPGLVAYASSKGAIEAATRSLALELASQRIRVNAVAPGVAALASSSGGKSSRSSHSAAAGRTARSANSCASACSSRCSSVRVNEITRADRTAAAS